MEIVKLHFKKLFFMFFWFLRSSVFFTWPLAAQNIAQELDTLLGYIN